jgi:predicted Zn-dependent protease with MMP-like domain
MTQDEFKQIVAEGINVIPLQFLQKLNNVAIVIEDEPTPAQKKKLMIRQGLSLFGLYEGVPQSTRGINYNAVLPDKITIFQKSIESAARNNEEIKEIVKNTVWHEIAHHFGMNEKEVHQAEIRRKKI